MNASTASMDISRIEKDRYPFLLQQMGKPPPFLDVIGAIPSDEYRFLCVIGSRKHSSYGEQACRKLIGGLTGYPICIVSGLAIGIDSLAHEAALDAGLKTVAFPGSGLSPDVLYPPSRRGLAKRIVEDGGALISPFKRDQRAAQWTFPRRNELMAGMCHATLVIEAREDSGTLITAQAALDLYRDVLAVPGSIFSELSYGPHKLMRDGAAPIASSEDILRCLGLAPRAAPPRTDLDSMSLSKAEKAVCSRLTSESLSATSLAAKTSLPMTSVNQALSELEIRGIIEEEGGLYRLV